MKKIIICAALLTFGAGAWAEGLVSDAKSKNVLVPEAKASETHWISSVKAEFADAFNKGALDKLTAVSPESKLICADMKTLIAKSAGAESKVYSLSVGGQKAAALVARDKSGETAAYIYDKKGVEIARGGITANEKVWTDKAWTLPNGMKEYIISGTTKGPGGPGGHNGPGPGPGPHHPQPQPYHPQPQPHHPIPNPQPWHPSHCVVMDQSGTVDGSCQASNWRCYADVKYSDGRRDRVYGSCTNSLSDCWSSGVHAVRPCGY